MSCLKRKVYFFMPVRRNIRIMYAVSLLQGMVFYAPIATLYRQQAGLGVFEITLIESISMAIGIVLEIPWGIMADRIGYRKSMIACCGMWFVSKLIFWQADGFGMFLLERVLLGAVFAGLSGLDQSILYCSAKEKDAQRVFGIYGNCGTAGVLLAAAVYSLFIGDNYRLAGLLTAICYGAAAILSLGLREVKTERAEQRGMLESFSGAVRELFRNRKLLMLVIGCALIEEVNQTITVFLNQLQYMRCGMTAAAIGIVYIGISLLELTGGLSYRLTKRFGAKRLGIWIFAGSAAACIVLAATESAWLSVLSVALIHAGVSVLWPLKSDLANKAVDAPDRVTALSVNHLLADGIAIGTNLIFGRLSDQNLPLAMDFGAVLSVAGLVLFVKSQKSSKGSLTLR